MLRDQPFMRDDTFLGVCQTLGDGLRIPSNLVRIAIAPLLVWNPMLTLSVYVVVGIVIAVAHAVIPSAAKPATAAPVSVAEPVVVEDEPMILAKAA